MSPARPIRVAVAVCLAGAGFCGAAMGSDAGDGDDLFVDGVVTHVRVEVSGPDLEILRGYAFQREVAQEERPSVRGIVREGRQAWTNVAVQLKGSAGSFRSVDDTPSFTLNFSKHAEAQRFHGLEKISLNTSVQDPSRVSEKLCRELYTRGGIPVPRAGYATVEFNGRPLGVYVLLEGWNRQFIGRHFADARGPLYEGRFLTDIDQPLKVAYGKTNGLARSLADLRAACAEPNPAARWARLETVLDLDRFTRLLALDALAWNGDGYAFHVNNYRVLHDRAQDRFVFLAHGLDQMFTLPDAPVLGGGDGSVAWAVLSLPEGRRRVLERIREYRGTIFQTEALQRRALALGAQVSLAQARAAGQTNPAAPPPPAPAVFDFVQRLTERLAAIDVQLAGLSNLVPLRTSHGAVPLAWGGRVMAGGPAFELSTNDAPVLKVRGATGAAGAWVAGQWLEHGRYRWEGRVRRVADPASTNSLACGFRVRAPRKRSLTLDWGWDGRRRTTDEERFNLVAQPLPAAAGTNWTQLSCEIDLRQPVADVEILCEAAGAGEAWFDLRSLRLTRLSDPGRD